MAGILALEGFQKNLKQLQCSDLMSSSVEYVNMYHTINDYFDLGSLCQFNQKTCVDTKVRPFSSNAPNSSDKPFLYTLVKLLLDVNSQNDEGSRSENLQRVYQWYCSNKRSIRANQTRANAYNSDTQSNLNYLNAYVYPKTSPASLLPSTDRSEHLLQNKYVAGRTHVFPTASLEIRSDSRRNKCLSRTPPRSATPNNRRKVKSGKERSKNSPTEEPEHEQRQNTSDGTIVDVDDEEFHAKEDVDVDLQSTQDNLITKYKTLDLCTTPIIDVHIKRLSDRDSPSPRINNKSPGREIFEVRKCNVSPCREDDKIWKTTGIRLDEDENLYERQHATKSATIDKKGNKGKYMMSKQMIPLRQQRRRQQLGLGLPKRQLTKPRNGYSGHTSAPVTADRKTELKVEPDSICSAGNVGKSVWVSQDAVFPLNHGYINFTRSVMHNRDDNSEALEAGFSFKDFAFPAAAIKHHLEEKKKLTLNYMQKQKEKAKPRPIVGPSIKPRGQHITLKPRPPNLTTYVGRSSQFSRKFSVGKPPNTHSVDNKQIAQSSTSDENMKGKLDQLSTVNNEQQVDTDDSLKRQNKAAVDIQKIFRGHVVRRHMDEVKKNREEREKRAARDKNLSAKTQRQQAATLSKVVASKDIYNIFHNATNAEKNHAATHIQRMFKGWYVRRQLEKSRSKIEMRSLSFRNFIHEKYVPHLIAIMKRHGETSPRVVLQFNELLQYVSDRNKYEVQFEHTANAGSLSFKDIKAYLAVCGLFPSKQEIVTALKDVSNKEEDNYEAASYSKAEIVNMTFEIYLPKGTRLKDVRKSTWMNPLIGGEEAIKLIGKKGMDETSLDKCMDFVQETLRNRNTAENNLNN